MATKDAPLFDVTLEISTDKLGGSIGALSANYLSVTPTMNWPFNSSTNISKYSFVTPDKLQFEVDFSGNIRLTLLQPVLLGLKGAEIIPRPTLKRPKLPFKLSFPKGVVLKAGERVIDTFPEVPPSPKVPSWFTSQPSPPTPPSLRRVGSPVPAPHGPSSPPDRQPSPSVHEEPQSKRRPPTNHRVMEEPYQAPDFPVRPSPRAGNGADAAGAKKRPRESAEDMSGLNNRAGGPGPSTAALDLDQGNQSGILAGNDSSVQKPKKKRRRKDKKSLANQSHAPARDPALDMVAGFWSNLGGAYMPLGEATKHINWKVSIAGIVRGISLPKATKNGDWSISVELLDPSTTAQNAFVVNLFLPESLKDCIPNVKAGDVLMLVKVVVVFYNNQARGTGYGDTFQWAGYSPTHKVHFHSARRAFSDEDHRAFFVPGPEELDYAARLVEWWAALQRSAKYRPEGVPTLMAEPRGRSLITLAEAKVDVFFNCIVEILYTVPPGDQFAEMFITDYTTHPQFFNRRQHGSGEQDHVRVYGKRVLKVLLWGATQLEHVRELETPGYYYVDNLRVKFDSQGHLQGTLQDERRKIDKLRKNDPLLAELLQRKEEYTNRPPSPDISTTRAGHMGGRDFNLHTAGDLLPPPVNPPPKHVEPKQKQPQGQSITRLHYYNIVQTPIQKVLGHSSCPEIFRIRARVAAFEPYKLENFSRAYCTNCKEDIPPKNTACPDCEDFNQDYVAYQYRFRICVEEESADSTGYRASLVVDVSGKEAEEFLSGVPPANFRDAKNARKLRERLAPILGNLEAYQCDLAVGNSEKGIALGQYFDMLLQSHRSPYKIDGALDNKRYKLWGTELLPINSSA